MGNDNDPVITVKGREEEEERKGGAPPWLFGGGRSGGLLQRLGLGGRGIGLGGRGMAGAGASAGRMGLVRSLVAFLGSNAGKALTVAMICGSSVFSLYSVQMSAVKAKPSVSKRGVFNDPSQALARRQAEMNSLAAVAGANKGFFGEEQAAADAAAAGQTADGAQDAPVDAPETSATPIPGGIPDPSRIAAQAAQQLSKNKPGAGASSAAGGGGGSSSAGLPNLNGALASMKGVDGKTLPTKNLQAMRGGVHARAASLRGTGPARGRGAMSQLKHASRESRKGAASRGPEGQAYNAESAFSPAGASAGAGSSLGGAGVQSGGGSAGGGLSDSGDGGPISQPDPGTGEQKAPDAGSGTNQTPYQKELTMAVSLLMVASTIIMIVGMLSLAGNTPFTAFLKGIAKMLYIAAIAMAAMATLIGAMIMSKYGQQSQGMILTIGGGITTVAAGVAWAVGTTTGSWIAVLGGIAGLATSVGSLLAPSKVPATAPGADSKTSATSGTTAGK